MDFSSKKKLSIPKRILFSAVLIFVLLLIVETVLDLISTFHVEILNAERKRTLEPYQGRPWADQYFKDIIECWRQSKAQHRKQYVRYVLHDALDTCATPTINFGNSTRNTWNPESVGDSPDRVVTVGMFGGSTMLGLGTIDELTIPSHFSRIVNENEYDGRTYIVTNYGVGSYTFTQSIMKLLLLLREGERFDYVVFYSGVNDIENAYEANEAGALYAEKVLKVKLEGTRKERLHFWWKNQLNSCSVCRAIVIFSRNTPVFREYVTPYLLTLRDAAAFKEGKKDDDETIAKLAGDIAGYYADSHGVLDALSRAYGFRYSEFWQPALLSEDVPVAGEAVLLSSDPRLHDEKLKRLYRLTREAVNQKKLTHFFDLSDELLGRTEAVYIDATHPSGEANELLARKIAEALGLSR